jgi:hypothetical protein
MNTSFYQGLKLALVRHIHFRPHDPFHIYIGFFAFLATAALTKKGFDHPLCLLPGFALSILMEVLDLRDNFVYAGTLRWSDSVHGVVVTNLIPVLLWAYARYRLITKGVALGPVSFENARKPE